MRLRFHPSARINLFVFCYTSAPMQGGSKNKDFGLDHPSDPMWLIARTGALETMDCLFGCIRSGLVKPLFSGNLHQSPDPDKVELFDELIKDLHGPTRKTFRKELISDRLVTEVLPAEKGFREIPTLNGAILIPGGDAIGIPFFPKDGFPLFLNSRHLQGFAEENTKRQKMSVEESLSRSMKRKEVIENGTYHLNLSFPGNDLEFAQHALSTFEERSRTVREASWKKSMSIRIG